MVVMMCAEQEFQELKNQRFASLSPHILPTFICRSHSRLAGVFVCRRLLGFRKLTFSSQYLDHSFVRELLFAEATLFPLFSTRLSFRCDTHPPVAHVLQVLEAAGVA